MMIREMSIFSLEIFLRDERGEKENKENIEIVWAEQGRERERRKRHAINNSDEMGNRKRRNQYKRIY